MLLVAESAFEARFGWEARVARLAQRRREGRPPGDLPTGHRLNHLPSIRQLWWTLERLDRYADLGEGRPGAGLGYLEQLLDGHALDVEQGAAAPPRHLGYFLPALQAEAKRCKHTWAPRVKDRRIREGRRRPRRAAGSPGRGGPATGQRPSRRRQRSQDGGNGQ
jgi:hypothetical protein